ncbi:MAG: trans-sulfuration enzyme family protein [Thermoplasmatota archaeon]
MSDAHDRNRGPSTTAIHGDERGSRAGPTVTPIAQASTFAAESTQAFDDIYEGRRAGYVYSRYANPTCEAVAHKIALLERAEACIVTASGMGAISATVLAFAKAGGRIVSTQDLYGGTASFFANTLARLGVRVDYVPTTDTKAIERALRSEPAQRDGAERASVSSERPQLLYLESPTNPTLRLVDLKAAAAAARAAGVPSVVDSTFATPVNSRPHELGIDVVVHSATKYLGGHSDITAGAIVGSHARIAEILPTVKSLGPTLDPFAAFLLERGLKTLAPRVRAANANALALAQFVERQPKVERVHYPGLSSHPQHALARAQMPGGFGGLVSFDVAGGKAAAARFVDALEIAKNAASLGGVDSLVSLPVVQSHRNWSPERLAASGIAPGTVRFACGIEDTEDLLADVEQALARV